MSPTDVTDTQQGAPNGAPLFEARDVAVRFKTDNGDVEALRSFDCNIGKGEFVSFVGPSGCGKTTLLKLISGLLSPSAGTMYYRGAPLTATPPGIGMAFQDSLLLPWRNVIDNILLPVEILRKPRSEYLPRAHELLKTVGLVGFETKAVWELSGGMRQRVSLCRALITSPQVLLLDEPFAALDAFTREELWLVLQDLHAKTKCTMVLITHQLNESVFLSDRVYVVSRRPGHVVFESTLHAPRPRSLELTLTPAFIGDVAALRHRIEH